MKKLMLLVAVFMLGGASAAFAQEPVKKEQPATEQTENKKEVKEETKEEPKAETPATEEKAAETPAQPAE